MINPQRIFLFFLFTISWVYSEAAPPKVKVLLSEQWQEKLLEKISQNETPKWMLKRIKKDLAPFTKISKSQLDEIIETAGVENSYLLVRYEIKNNQLFVSYAKNVETHERFKIITKTLESLCKCTPLPNVDFIISLHDSSPFTGTNDFKGPLLVFAKNQEKDRHCILIPDFEALEGHSKLLKDINTANKRFPWSRKVNQAIWRGGSSGENNQAFPRIKLVEISLKFPTYVDAKINPLVQINKETKKLLIKKGYFGNALLLQDHMRYKYQILVDGNTCAYSRAYWQLFCNSLMFKQDSPNIQWYYDELKPYVHYIPVAHDFTDLIEKIRWADEHEKDVEQIILNANAFGKEKLKHEDVMLYLYLLLKEYSNLSGSWLCKNIAQPRKKVNQ